MGLAALPCARLSVLFGFLRACERQKSEAEAPSSQTRREVLPSSREQLEEIPAAAMASQLGRSVYVF